MLFTRNLFPLQSSKFSFEYLLLPPRSALKAVPHRLTPRCCLTTFTPSYSLELRICSKGWVSVTSLSAIHFQGWFIRQVSCYTGCSLGFPPARAGLYLKLFFSWRKKEAHQHLVSELRSCSLLSLELGCWLPNPDKFYYKQQTVSSLKRVYQALRGSQQFDGVAIMYSTHCFFFLILFYVFVHYH